MNGIIWITQSLLCDVILNTHCMFHSTQRQTTITVMLNSTFRQIYYIRSCLFVPIWLNTMFILEWWLHTVTLWITSWWWCLLINLSVITICRSCKCCWDIGFGHHQSEWVWMQFCIYILYVQTIYFMALVYTGAPHDLLGTM